MAGRRQGVAHDQPDIVNTWQRRSTTVASDLPLDLLNPREHRLFVALGKGKLNKQIAEELGLSVATVETYRKSISAKLGLSGSELVRAAVLFRVCGSAGLSHEES